MKMYISRLPIEQFDSRILGQDKNILKTFILNAKGKGGRGLEPAG